VTRALRRLAWLGGVGCLISAAAGAQDPPAPQRVEITAPEATDTEQRRRDPVAKTVVGREELDRYGDSSVNDVLKRLPGVNLQGGNPRLRGLGAGVHLVSRAEGGFLGSIDRAEAFAAAHPGAFLPRQFSNVQNVAAHESTTGPEIARQLAAEGLLPDAFVAGVGTGGTVMGVGRYLRRIEPHVRIHPLEPASSPTLTVGHKVGSHRIQGISDEFVPAIVDLDFLDPVVSVDDGDAILMAQRLARDVGLAVGISSGANFLGAVKVQDALWPDATVVTVFADDDKKYLSTDLLREEPLRPGYMTPEIELLGFDALSRL
jgi:cysteine synthase A